MAQELIPIFRCETIVRPGILLVLQFQGTRLMRDLPRTRDAYWPIEVLATSSDRPIYLPSIPVVADDLSRTRVCYMFGEPAAYIDRLRFAVGLIARDLGLPYSADNSLCIFSPRGQKLGEASPIPTLTSAPVLDSSGRGRLFFNQPHPVPGAANQR
jgi:hypothetical protein